MNVRALHKLGYGLYVVCSRKSKKLNGQIANTVFQITSEPPTIAVSINKSNLTHEFIAESGVFVASVLSQDTPLYFIGHFGFCIAERSTQLNLTPFGDEFACYRGREVIEF